MRLMRVIAVLFVCSVTLVGQTNKGGISGTVTDQNGALVPGATVVLFRSGTNQSQTLTTSEAGSYSASSLEPVAYSIRVEMKGFKKALVGKVKVDTATVATVNISLETGTIDQTVTINSDAQLINTESGTTSQTIDRKSTR